eukprot:gnl/TRDRNA2_/TRDRNA2_202411_c0_seq1.p1 gnl/TRDRNA2_/TRDRNA2_202411_c0~~gnl/TRDRNA2_/TRDRNA2_202411_c0_seq1.p1  ORF type:complete len:346 (+),score=57.13 gnl/TRDRNA2_/TRDRNA2_202411_c0_seq1:101-1138(+)
MPRPLVTQHSTVADPTCSHVTKADAVGDDNDEADASMVTRGCREELESLARGLSSVRAELWYADRAVQAEICDARGDPSRFVLDECGWVLLEGRKPSACTAFYDPASVVLNHYPEAAEAVRSATGAVLVLPFSHTTRNAELKATEQEQLPPEERTRSLTGPAYLVHNDHRNEPEGSKNLAFRQLAATEGEEAVEVATEGRFAVLNSWQALAPIQRDPLALADWRSLAVDEYYGADGSWYSPAHRWYYFSSMAPGETLVFKQFDSDPSVSGCAIHAAFEPYPELAEAAPPRESVDVRCLAFFGPLPPNFGDAFLAKQRAKAEEELAQRQHAAAAQRIPSALRANAP